MLVHRTEYINVKTVQPGQACPYVELKYIEANTETEN